MLVYRDLPGSVGPIYSDAQPPSWLLALTSDESLSSDLLNSSLYLHHSGPKSHPHLLSGGLHRTSYRLSETLAPCQVSALALILPSHHLPYLALFIVSQISAHLLRLGLPQRPVTRCWISLVPLSLQCQENWICEAGNIMQSYSTEFHKFTSLQC